MKFLSIPGLAVLVLLLAACGSVSTPANTSSTPTAVLGDGSIKNITLVTQSGDFNNPLDSTPDVNGTTIYFTATGPHGKGVFQVPASGGAATEVFTGSPFVAPRCLVVSLDGQLIYVADPGAGNGGAIFALPLHGGSPSIVRGSQQTAPQNIDVVSQNGQETIYFSGKDPSSGMPAILKLPVKGADAASVVVKGSPLVAPDGIVVTQSGTLYVSDRSAAGTDSGQIFKIEGSSIQAIVARIHTGNPAGIALSPDESLLLVSAYQSNSTNDQVLLVDLATLQTGSVTKIVGQNQNAAGLHASHANKSILSWADVSRSGKVYRVES